MSEPCPICGTSINAFNKGDVMAFPEIGLPRTKVCVKCSGLLWRVKTGVPHGEFKKSDVVALLGDPAGYTAMQQLIYGYVPAEYTAVHLVEAARREELASNMLITTTPVLQGYTITVYHGFVSAEVALGLGFFKGISAGLADMTGSASSSLGGKLSAAKQAVLDDLKNQVLVLGGNAIVGLNFEYVSFGEMTGAVAIGTAVTIEHEQRSPHTPG